MTPAMMRSCDEEQPDGGPPTPLVYQVLLCRRLCRGVIANDCKWRPFVRKPAEKQRPRIAGPGLQTSALPLGYGALADGRNLIDDAIATPATRMFATITGSEWISTP